jgi:hypothetical protein
MAIIGFGVCVVALGMFAGLVGHWLFASRIHPRDWRRRFVAVLRFFIGERSA